MQDRGCESLSDTTEDSDNPTPTPTQTPTINPTSGVNPPEASPTPSMVSIRPIANNAIAGEVIVAGKGVPNVRVIVPELGEIALTNKDGMYSIPAPGSEEVSFTLKVRSLMLANGGYDVPAKSGTFVSIKPQEIGSFKAYDCSEKSKLAELYSMGRLVAKLSGTAKRDQKKLVSASKKEPSGRALRRLNFSAAMLLDINAALPEKMLTCQASQNNCSEVSLKPALRQLRSSLKHLRLESLYLNRLLREDSKRSDGKSQRRIKAIKKQTTRLKTLIEKLGKRTFVCK